MAITPTVPPRRLMSRRPRVETGVACSAPQRANARSHDANPEWVRTISSRRPIAVITLASPATATVKTRPVAADGSMCRRSRSRSRGCSRTSVLTIEESSARRGATGSIRGQRRASAQPRRPAVTAGTKTLARITRVSFQYRTHDRPKRASSLRRLGGSRFGNGGQMASASTHATRPRDNEPPSDAWPTRVGDIAPERTGLRARYPRATAAASVLVAGYVAVGVAMLALGLLVTKVLAGGPVGRADVEATRWLSEHRDGALDLLTSVLSRSADTAGAVAIALLVVIILARRRRWRDAGVLVAGLGLELFTFLAVNFLVDRPRPAVPKLGSVPS